jgi:hypothetical protein
MERRRNGNERIRISNRKGNNPYLDPEANAQDFKVLAEALRLQADYIKHLEEGLESSIKLNKAQAERQEK